MVLRLDTIKPNKGSRKTRKRIGRGLSKKGTYSGRGTKGQRSRSGGKSSLQLKGIRTIMLATPKTRGFRSTKAKPEVVNLLELAKNYADGAKVTPESLVKKNLINTVKNGAKILGKGEISIKLIIVGCSASESAKIKIEKAGGSLTNNAS
ncbi:MAG: 50S ribosomal protein L15 [Candidatus Uhrbacteria bacterium GW2011_GWE2_40_58]|nr:MAG: 50S ribosomal protein L15 [Candidatus Uhrbacteria bacterium GW2011_GWF2_40_263]KKR67526.1 MAG: 50S ribosomal protein L15 [Candidatus Uhrbacteria bacterium GW2011_GWE2_40_58]OGL93712.1 MAG: 50S ribosomal protein L15 [Candidatus Uhrbacteria bacterium RIFOXYA2_FULL_40_9]OGL96449.1 MAG: 50S ribosomal protein L15 [Candidatus Uhrbacteria bacterium RIFOXYB2_FULL_41_18]HBK34860.1 50S ribosomal protein L15 [Candidatus Uhrbacteria bacterium]